jgi:hypothetical protein
MFSDFGFFDRDFLTTLDSATSGGGVEVKGANACAVCRKKLYWKGRNTSAPSIFRK